MGQLRLRQKPISTVKGILFDKDGTLSYSEPYLLSLASARIRVLKEQLRSIHSNETVARRAAASLASVCGIQMDRMQNATSLDPAGLLAVASREHNMISTAAVLCLQGHIWSEALLLAEEIFSEVDILLQRDTNLVERPLVTGAWDALSRMYTAGITCAVMSNDTRASINDFLKCQSLGRFIADSWGADDYPSKPNPQAVYMLCQRLKLEPAECALVSDSEADLVMAQRAGVGVSLGFTSGWSQLPHLSTHNYLINHWEELTAVPVQCSTKALS